MQKKTKGILFALLLGLVLPAILIEIVQGTGKQQKNSAVPAEQTQQTQETQVQPNRTENVFLLPVLMEDGTVRKIELDAYITGVVIAEMPTDFETEALKAQAVVARTYALKRFLAGEKHPEQAICTDPSCCQAYCDLAEFLNSGGAQECLDKVADAVMQTHMMVLTYNGEMIDATYFSCSGGRTEDALSVWGSDVPYLRSVVSPGEENSAHYMDTVFFTLDEFSECMQIDGALLNGSWIGNITYTNGGGVDTISICGHEYSGTEIRQKLGLRSTSFVMTAVGNTVTVTTKGFGHRVGMSQYGADAMAVSGSSYEEILTYYYQGTKLEEYEI